MIRLASLVILLVIFLDAKEFQNNLQYETSPYLQAHATNPINWMPWSKKAFLLAKKENKPIFLSIGYSTCHWCHVMAQESFTNKALAKIFNKNFICIKVDREELPHVDSYYQNLYYKINHRSAGWPLNVFLSSEKKPLYLSSYIPPKKMLSLEGFDTLLPKIASMDKVYNTLSITENNIDSTSIEFSLITLQKTLHNSYDDIYGGFEGSRKFPQAQRLWLMLDVAQLTKDEQLQEYYFNMLDVMALRGLYDHIDGGFFRYTVDSSWKIPHFEKMLYNQAELIPLYTKGYMLSSNELYKDVVLETIDMVEKRFSKNFLFYSASDADTHHKEGEYFTFSYQEVLASLQNNVHKKEILNSLQITKNGNFKGKIHLNIYTEKKPIGFDKFNKKLQNIRKTKEYPFIDKKINTAWNAMMIEALFYAGVIDAKYVELANKHLASLKEMMFDKGELYHQGMLDKKPTQKALLEDYAFFIAALLAGYEADYDDTKLDFAVFLLHDAKSKFYKRGTWYLSDDGFEIKAGLKDKYYTSAFAKMVQNIVKIAALKGSHQYEEFARESLTSMQKSMQLASGKTPASLRISLMLRKNMIIIKSSKKNLEQKRVKILKLSYPYLMTKKIDNDNFLACTMRSCFAIDKEFSNVKMSIMLK